MAKRFLFGICMVGLIAAAFISMPQAATAQESPDAAVYLFAGRECPHCKAEKEFLDAYVQQHPNVSVREYEVWHDSANRDLFDKVLSHFDISKAGVPLTVIGDRYLQGFESPDTTGKDIDRLVREYAASSDAKDIVAAIARGDSLPKSGLSVSGTTVTIPFFGTFDISSVSIPLLSTVIGLVDGFNPCAMWSLIMLLGVLISLQNRTRLIILGGLFLLASAGIYYAFLAAWLNTMIFVGYVYAIRVLIGIIAAGAGIYSLYSYFTRPKGVCDISETQKYKRVFSSLQQTIKNKNFVLSAIGIMAAAVAVNVVELLCSVGLPVVYTSALAARGIHGVSQYLNLLIYTFFYMLDDIIVYLIAVWTAKIYTYNNRWSSYSPLIGGILMILMAVFIVF